MLVDHVCLGSACLLVLEGKGALKTCAGVARYHGNGITFRDFTKCRVRIFISYQELPKP